MRSTGEVIQILQAAKPELLRLYGVRRLALFGSYARGEQTAGSDVGILPVDVPPNLTTLLRIPRQP
jgi:predicted nucleotidyltransferase